MSSSFPERGEPVQPPQAMAASQAVERLLREDLDGVVPLMSYARAELTRILKTLKAWEAARF